MTDAAPSPQPARRKYYLKCLLVIFACAGFIAFELNTHVYFGQLVNFVFPCTQKPMNSFPCFGMYDVLLGIVLLIVAFTAFCLLAVALVRDFILGKRGKKTDKAA